MQATLSVQEKPRSGEEWRSVLWVFLTVIIALSLGSAIKVSVEGRTASFTAPGGAASLSFPSAWVRGRAAEGILLTVSDPRSPTSFSSAFTLRTRPVVQGQSLIDVTTGWMLTQSKALSEFNNLGTTETTLAGQRAIRLHYAYVAAAPSGAGPALLPVVVEANDTIVIAGSQTLIFSSSVDANHSDEYVSRFSAIMSSVKLAGQ
jgi:hypothetical protein